MNEEGGRLSQHGYSGSLEKTGNLKWGQRTTNKQGSIIERKIYHSLKSPPPIFIVHSHSPLFIMLNTMRYRSTNTGVTESSGTGNEPKNTELSYPKKVTLGIYNKWEKTNTSRLDVMQSKKLMEAMFQIFCFQKISRILFLSSLSISISPPYFILSGCSHCLVKLPLSENEISTLWN